ncbi:hypothetical protein [Nocardia sp. CY41]|uniref:hypothetical protein n=1 Tax=Nocardia sp. CY41 TaxID=2608686 RepID=UPI001359F860|nr:hypothetical protein [Nocardia sp. CY41]
MLVVDGLRCVALLLLQVHDPRGVEVLGDGVDGGVAEERRDVVADVGVVLAPDRLGHAAQPLGAAGQPVGQADAAAVTALDFQHFQSLVDADAVDESGPAFRGREVVEGFLGAATNAVLVVVLELDLPGDRTVGAAPGAWSEQ